MTDILLHKCKFCNYQSKRKFDVKRHQNAKHRCRIIENNSEIEIKGGEQMNPKILFSSMFNMALVGLALGSGYKFGISVAEKIDNGISNGIKAAVSTKEE